MDEKRTDRRTKVSMKVLFRCDSPAYVQGHVVNISHSGMFVETGNPPLEGDYVLASVDVEEFGKVVWVQGRVVRRETSGVAIAFTRSDQKGINALLAFHGVHS